TGNVNTFKRAYGGANQLDPVSVSAGNQLAVRVDQLLRSPNILWIGKIAPPQLCAGEPDVVDPFEQNNVSPPGHRQRVPVEASQGADAKAAGAGNEAVIQEPVTDYALVDHAHLGTFRRLSQTTNQIARPIVVRLHG